MTMTHAILLAGALCTATSAMAAPQTIVGTWQAAGQQCIPAAGAIVIEPMRIVADDHRCDFDFVSRHADVVTWHGVCRWPDDPKSAIVVAKLSGKHLRIDHGGGFGDASARHLSFPLCWRERSALLSI